ncbi:MAG: TolB family protein [bacterium]
MRKKRKTYLGLVSLLLLTLISGCTALTRNLPPVVGAPAAPTPLTQEGTPENEAAVTPFKELARITLAKGQIDYPEETSLSPDGSLVALVITSEKEQSLWLHHLENRRATLLLSIDKAQVEAGRLLLRILGWTKDNRLIFMRQGTQPDGIHHGQRGLVFYQATPEAGTAAQVTEINWLPVKNYYVRQVNLTQTAPEARVHVGDAIWRVPLNGTKPQPLKDKLPSYDGLFYPHLAPGGAYYVYELREENQNGIYLLDTTTGTETCLVPNGANLNFLPRWSPDGSHLAFYSAGLKAGHTDPYDKYDIIPAEDGPMPVAEEIHLITPSGKTTRLSLPGLKLAYFRWSADGRHLAFLAGAEKSLPDDDLRQGFCIAALWISDLDGNLTKIADLPEKDIFDITILDVDPQGQRVHFLAQEEEQSSLWLAQKGKEPQEIAIGNKGRGYFWLTHPLAKIGGSVFLVYDTEGARQIIEVNGDRAKHLVSGGWQTYLVGIRGKHLVYTCDSSDNKTTDLVLLEVK